MRLRLPGHLSKWLGWKGEFILAGAQGREVVQSMVHLELDESGIDSRADDLQESLNFHRLSVYCQETRCKQCGKYMGMCIHVSWLYSGDAFPSPMSIDSKTD